MESLEQEKTNYNYICVFASLFLWFVGLTYVSGFGSAYRIYEKTMYLTLLVFLFYFFSTNNFRFVNKNALFVIMFFVIHNVYTYYVYGFSYESYIWLYLIIFIFSLWNLTEFQMRIIGMAYGILGGVVLFYANYTSVLSGWDGNSISLTPFISYTAFAASLSNLRDAKKITAFIVYSLLYFYHLNTLGSRSTIWFSMVLLLCLFHIIPLKRMMKNKAILIILLLLPLIIAIFVVSVQNAPFVHTLDNWSYNHFNKPIFNGRDTIWDYGFQKFGRNMFLGNGDFYGRWHNSAVTILVGMGSIGYIVMLSIFWNIWKKGAEFSDDYVVYGLFTAFIICWLQQSVELGLVALKANPLYYSILGLMLARIKALSCGEENKKSFIKNRDYDKKGEIIRER